MFVSFFFSPVFYSVISSDLLVGYKEADEIVFHSSSQELAQLKLFTSALIYDFFYTFNNPPSITSRVGVFFFQSLSPRNGIKTHLAVISKGYGI